MTIHIGIEFGFFFFLNPIYFEPALEMLMPVCLPSTAIFQRKTSKYLKAGFFGLLVLKKKGKEKQLIGFHSLLAHRFVLRK